MYASDGHQVQEIGELDFILCHGDNPLWNYAWKQLCQLGLCWKTKIDPC